MRKGILFNHNLEFGVRALKIQTCQSVNEWITTTEKKSLTHEAAFIINNDFELLMIF